MIWKIYSNVQSDMRRCYRVRKIYISVQNDMGMEGLESLH